MGQMMLARILLAMGLLAIVGAYALDSASAAHRSYCIDIVFEPGGRILLDGRQTVIGSDLDQRLNAIARAPGPHRLCLVSNKQSNYAEIAAALAAIQKAGLRINMTAYERVN